MSARTILRGGWLLLALAAAVAPAAHLTSQGTVDSRIRTAAYNPEQVYRLYGFVGYAIELVFEDGETFAGEGGGDLDGITFGWHTNHLILKPKEANVGTNLVIYTDRRAYRFEYSATDRPPRASSTSRSSSLPGVENPSTRWILIESGDRPTRPAMAVATSRSTDRWT